MRERRERAGGFAACALLAFPAALPQKSKPVEPPPAVDPYTRGEPQALARAGYRSFGPLRFGPSNSETVQSHLGDVPMLWVETEHFRLGSSLEEYRPTSPQEVDELRQELAGLAEVVERVPAKPKKLDPWLRLHLFARRLERLHADFSARLALGTSTADGRTVPVPAMKEKLSVLLTQKKSTLARFTREYCGAEHGENHIQYYQELGALFFGVSDESVALGDSELCYALVYGVAQSLVYSLEGFPHNLPAWWTNGLALWFARAHRPRVLLYSRPAGELLPPEELADWQPLVRGRVEAGAVLAWKDMLAREKWQEQPFGDNVVLWSRLDFLLRRADLAGALAAAMHQPVPEVPDSLAALRSATGLELEALDAEWRAWVLDSYRKKRK